MPKSLYAERFNTGIALIHQIRDEQLGRLERATAPDRHHTLNDWTDLAKAERAVKERYQGRYLFELLQNANDAAIEAAWRRHTDLKAIFHNAQPVRIQLTERALFIANHGASFSADNVKALCRLHNSTKSPSKQIGHKGIGFKSVLEITHAPEIYSDCYAFSFSHLSFTNDVQKIMGKGWSASAQLPILRAPYPLFINQLPPEERDCLEALLNEDYVTVIRLPLAEGKLTAVEQRLRNDISPRLLLFMPAISQIEIVFPDNSGITYSRQIRADNLSPNLTQVILYRGTYPGDDTTPLAEESRWLVMGPLERAIPTKNRAELLKDLGEAWQEITALRFSLAFPLQKKRTTVALDGHSEPFHVYYPTQEPSGLRFIINADFYVGDDRKTLPSNSLNTWLSEEISLFLAGEGIDLLKQHLNSPSDLIELLAPINKPEREFATRFMQSYLTMLKDAPIIQTHGQHYKPSTQIKLPPEKADHEKLYHLFPAARLRGQDKWSYPDRSLLASSKALTFLKTDLEIETITIADITTFLKEYEMPPLAEAAPLIDFIVMWWYQSDLAGKKAIEDAVRTVPILPTTNGWLYSGSTLIFQANLRPNQPEIKASGFNFSVILRSVYPPRDAANSPHARFFAELEVTDYSARSLLQRAILPVLTDEKKLATLYNSHPDAIVDGYKILFDYYHNERSRDEIGSVLGRTLVPATKGQGNAWQGWRPASNCYFGCTWSAVGEKLEQSYSGFADCFFLDTIPGLPTANNHDIFTQWVNFFSWLGVSNCPTLKFASNLDHKASSPVNNTSLWDQYLQQHCSDFNCTNNGVRHYNDSTRHLDTVYSLHHFYDLVCEANPEKLQALLEFVSHHWSSYYKGYTQARLSCRYPGCRYHYQDIENYFLFELCHTKWLPADLPSATPTLLAPSEIWTIGETEPSAVRALVPSIPSVLSEPRHRDFVQSLGFISVGNAQIEHFITLLQSLSHRHPIHAERLDDPQFKTVLRAISSLFNWACERIQIGLVNRSDKEPVCPADMQILAFRNDLPTYVPIGASDLFLADNPILKQRWSEHCAFVRFNDDWARLREWLGIPRLSEKIDAQRRQGALITDLTDELYQQFMATLPFFLALVKESQPANYESIRGRLERLSIHVVENLEVEERLCTDPTLPPITSPEKVYLHTTTESGSRGGLVMRGEIYVTREFMHNYDLLGSLIADYIEIARLGDAFVLLMDRADPQRKRQFLHSKGITDAFIAEVFADLGRPDDEFTLPPVATNTYPTTHGLAQDKIQELTTHSTTTAPSSPQPQATHNNESDPALNSPTGDRSSNLNGYQHRPTYPKLEFNQDLNVRTIELAHIPPSTPAHHKASREHASSTHNGSIPNQQTTQELGRRGEEWVYEAERQRLRKLNLDPDMLERDKKLSWVSKNHPTSPYDIRSLDVTTSGEIVSIFIEVKASSDSTPRIHMSRQEIEFAFEHGDRHWLYLVLNVTQSQPDLPVRLCNIGRLIVERRISFDLDSISLKLPVPTDQVTIL